MDPDEGIVLQGAQRILQGQVLYRDFFSYFTPGSYYVLALLFKAFGSSMLVARTAPAVYGSLFSGFTYVIARRVCSRWSALLVAYLVTITCLPWRFLVLHNWDSTLWACGAIYCAVRWTEVTADQKAEGTRQKADRNTYAAVACLSDPGCSSLITRHSSPRWWAFATGSFVSLTALFEQSKGAGLALGLGMGFVILALAGKNQQAEGRTQKAETKSAGHCPSLITRHSSLSLCVGFAWPFLLTFAYFGAHHALHQMLTDWLWPLHHYTKANNVAYGYQDWSSDSRTKLFYSGSVGVRLVTLVTVSPCFVIPALPILAVILLAQWLLRVRHGALPPERAVYYVLICSSIAGLLASVILVRANIIHFVYLAPIFYLVLAWIIDGANIHGTVVGAIRPLVTILIFGAFTAVGMSFVVRNVGGRERIETRRGLVTGSAPDTVLSYTQAHMPAGSKILVYPYLPLYYYLTATYSPTRFEYLQPGMYSRNQDDEAIQEIQASRTRTVLFELGFNQKIAASWPNTPIQDIANDPVGDYILAHYRSCKVLRSAAGWPFLFMVAKDAACPR
jgi:Dolichyl-phosphate-mannose-protein mannosyltransferase